MTLSSATFGHFRLFTIETGHFRLDGGAMFGVVPKTLWSRHITCDEHNRILLSARCLLIHSNLTDRAYLVDTGIGHKFDKKYSEIYQLDFSEYRLERSLSWHGFTSSDITDVIFTHMHFDHCGGAVATDDDGNKHLTFPNANHWVHKSQWESVMNPNIREQASFLPENIDPLKSSGAIKLVDDGHSYEPGFDIEVVHGHTDGQQLPLLTAKNRQLIFAADLLPTIAHLPLPWVMSLDIRPLVTFEEKKKIFDRCIRKNTLLFLEHDPYHELIQLKGDPAKPEVSWSGKPGDW